MARQPMPPTPEHLKTAIPADGPTAPLTGVLIKLGLFTLAMVVLPVGSYFLSRDWYFGDNLTGAGITAATVANLILVAFVVVALREDMAEAEGSAGTGSGAGAVGGDKKKKKLTVEGKKDL